MVPTNFQNKKRSKTHARVLVHVRVRVRVRRMRVRVRVRVSVFWECGVYCTKANLQWLLPWYLRNNTRNLVSVRKVASTSTSFPSAPSVAKWSFETNYLFIFTFL